MSEGSSDEFRFDWQRAERTGVPEVVLAESKSTQQLIEIAGQCLDRGRALLMTRVSTEQARMLLVYYAEHVHVHAESRTVVVGRVPARQPAAQADTSSGDGSPGAGSRVDGSQGDRSQGDGSPGVGSPGVGEATAHPDGHGPRIAIVAAGSSDMPVVAEIEQTLLFLGESSRRYVDVGVAGLWRLASVAEELSRYRIIIAVAGMEGALFSVLGGLVAAPVIAVPVSVGYGVGQGGRVALDAALCTCAPGIAVVNIDNGFGAAALAVKMLGIARAGIIEAEVIRA